MKKEFYIKNRKKLRKLLKGNYLAVFHSGIVYPDSADENFDLPNHHLLTQDFIYNIAFHLAKDFKPIKPEYANIEKLEATSLKIRIVKPKL